MSWVIRIANRAGGFAYVCLRLWMRRASEWASACENAYSGTFRSESRTWGVSPILLHPSALRWGSSLIQKLIVLSRLSEQQTLGVHLSLTPNAEVTGMYSLV